MGELAIFLASVADAESEIKDPVVMGITFDQRLAVFTEEVGAISRDRDLFELALFRRIQAENDCNLPCRSSTPGGVRCGCAQEMRAWIDAIKEDEKG